MSVARHPGEKVLGSDSAPCSGYRKEFEVTTCVLAAPSPEVAELDEEGLADQYFTVDSHASDLSFLHNGNHAYRLR